MGYTYAEGDLYFDPSIPIDGASSKLNAAVIAYQQTVDLVGRSGNVLVEMPYAWGQTSGEVSGVPDSADFSGLGDLGFTLTINLHGAPTLSVDDFLALRAEPRPLIGASLKVIAPTGRYDKDRLINVGENRWQARIQGGAVIPLAPKWLFEFKVGAWHFEDNPDFVAGEREQDPLYSMQTNLVHRFKPGGVWASIDVTYFRGGQQTIGGDRLSDEQRNVKLGGTLVIPFGGRHAIKLGYANGVVTRFGSDFDQWLLSYQTVF